MNDNKQHINRIRVVLVEKKYTAKWRTNSVQPGLETLLQIANIFDIDVRTLIIQSKKDHLFYSKVHGLWSNPN